MHLLRFLASCALAGTALATFPDHARNTLPARTNRRMPKSSETEDIPAQNLKRVQPVVTQNQNTTKFKVDGTDIPDVDFDVGESYAGLLPISDEEDASELYFWFFPSENPEATDEILIWLNGGPGCSSMEGLLQENGPFLWQYGTYKPVQNQWTWTNLTNVVWVDQPAGTGFSKQRGTPPAKDNTESAAQFLGFWKNFLDTFDLHNRKIYLAGESYAGYYVPYIADAMLNKTDKTYYGVESIIMFDAATSYDVVQGDAVVVPFVDAWSGLFNFNKTFTDQLHRAHQECGYANFMETNFNFPPNGLIPTPPDVYQQNDTCRLTQAVATAAPLINPCWNPYQVTSTCPVPWDVLGFPGILLYTPDGAIVYFNRTDVQKAINAPVGPWQECTSERILEDDDSPPSALSILPRVIEKTAKTIIVHADLDLVIIKNGTIISIQNMTWSGAQGFSKGPCDWNEFYVPYHPDAGIASMAGAGVLGVWYTERGLTFCSVALSGHMVPQYAPSAAFRQVEFLLGRIGDLGVVGDFTTLKGNGSGKGNGMVGMF